MTVAFGQLLRRYRTAAGFSQEHLAGLARISVESVGALERGTRRAPYRDTVALIADALELDADERAALEAAANAARARGTRNAPAIEPPAPNPHLPLPSTSLVGREQDIAGITALLKTSRLVTITGSGGVGKTRVAIEVAARLPGQRLGDVRFVDLSRLTDGALVAGAVSASLGIPSDSANGIADLAQSLRSSQAFLVLDNCEHLIADVALLVSALLPSCPGIALLAASRERLAVSGEVVYRLPSLDLPADMPASLDQARAYAAIELFVQRSAAIDHTVAFRDADVSSIVDICRRLDGIPLALELAAARVAVLGLDAVRTRIREGIKLTTSLRNLPARQQTMQATIAWSYDLLSPHEQTVLRALSLFLGGCTLSAAESVCGVGEIAADTVAEHISSLVDKSLVNVVRTESLQRFTLLDSVRSFAFERLKEVGDVAFFSARHAEWMASFADWVDTSRAEFPERRLRTEVDPELENARAALTWALEQGTEGSAVIAGRIVGGLRTIWLTSGRYSECRRWAYAILDVIDDNRHPRVIAPLLRTLVQIAVGAELFALAERAMPVFESIGDRMGMTLLLSHVAHMHRRLGFLDEADAAIEEAGAIFAAADLPRLEPYTAFLNYRVQLRLDQGRYDEAFADLDEMGAILSSLGDDDALTLRLLRAEAESASGQNTAAIRGFEATIERAQNWPVPYTRILQRAYSDLAVLHALEGDIDSAHRAGREALRWTSGPLTLDDIRCALFEAIALIAALRGEAHTAAKLLGVSDAIINMGMGSNKSFYERPRARLIETLSKTLTPQEIERLRHEGSAFTLERALAEAQKV